MLVSPGATDGGCGDPSKERKRTAGVESAGPPELQTGEPGLLCQEPRIQITRAAPVLIGATLGYRPVEPARF